MTVRQTAGRDQLGDFAPAFARINDDVLFGEVRSHFMTIRQALGRLCQKSFFLTATLVFIVSNYGRKAQGTRFCARRIYIIAMSVFLQRVAINSGYIMQELISTHLQRHDRTVWLHITIKRRICRNSHHFVHNCKEQSQRHDNG